MVLPWTSRGSAGQRKDLDQVRELYDSGLSFAEVGQRIGYSPTYLARKFKIAGIPARAAGRPLTTPAPPVDLDELERLRDAGWTYPELASRYGVSTDVVRTRYMRRKGLPLRRAEAERRGVPFRVG